MSCNGCRVLRKGCSDTCILRPCLPWIESSEAQANATVFVAKFFGRAGLMSFISAVPPSQRAALFQSLLFEAAGRTVNPVTGAVGLFRMGNWHVCQKAVETIFRGGTLQPIPELLETSAVGSQLPTDVVSNPSQFPCLTSPTVRSDNNSRVLKRRRSMLGMGDLDLNLKTGFPVMKARFDEEPRSPDMDFSEESVTTNIHRCEGDQYGRTKDFLNLFN